VVAEHQDIETGKGADTLDRRPMLRKALAQAKKLSAPPLWPSSIA
jgi:hypothetical protein